jgi:hypothetical protein
MTAQSVTLKTVEAPPYQQNRLTMTPRLSLVVRYTKGGKNAMTLAVIPRGYEITVQFDRLDNEGSRYVPLDGKPNPAFTVESAARFTPKAFARIVSETRNGKHCKLIDELYRTATDQRPEIAWAVSIFPLDEQEPAV